MDKFLIKDFKKRVESLEEELKETKESQQNVSVSPEKKLLNERFESVMSEHDTIEEPSFSIHKIDNDTGKLFSETLKSENSNFRVCKDLTFTSKSIMSSNESN